jgi:hypothetical protein
VIVKSEARTGGQVRARIPLPPGARLAEPVNGVRQVRGALLVDVSLAGPMQPGVVDIPLHFALSGNFTVPEAIAHMTDDDAPPAYAPARPIVVRP